VSYALKIPAEYKIYNGIDKWVLRRALEDLLPEPIVYRPKAKFWEGAGVLDLIAQHAKEYVSDTDFSSNRQITDLWALNSKEEMLYFQIFTECFGIFEDYSWMGRTKGAPVDP
jgi:asparagine synthase (glutamine-hydrolysing)